MWSILNCAAAEMELSKSEKHWQTNQRVSTAALNEVSNGNVLLSCDWWLPEMTFYIIITQKSDHNYEVLTYWMHMQIKIGNRAHIAIAIDSTSQ